MNKLNFSLGGRAGTATGEGAGATNALRKAHPGALAMLLAIGVGGFFFVDPSSKDTAWASLPRRATVTQPALQITPTQAIARGVQPSALGAASPFKFTALDPSSRERAERCLAEAIYFEAGSETEAGQRGVAQVILNRVRHAAFPNSVCGVVYQGSERTTGCQFTFTCDGSLARTPSRSGWQRALTVARQALDGEVYAPVGHATHYHATWVLPYWASSVAMVGRIGGHIFYSWKGAAGSAAAFSQAYSGLEAIKDRLVQPAAVVEVETAQMLENPALAAPVADSGALDDPRNADLLNYKAAENERGVVRSDENEVVKAIESAL